MSNQHFFKNSIPTGFVAKQTIFRKSFIAQLVFNINKIQSSTYSYQTSSVLLCRLNYTLERYMP